MHFFVHKRRQTPAVIIVALIDVLIVLLIFLMVTTTFRQQPSLKLALPESTQAQRTGAAEAPPLVIAIDPQGNVRFGPDARPVTIEQLKEELTIESAKKPDLKVALSADKNAPFGQVVKVLDTVKQANTNINVVSAFMKQAAKP